MTHPLKLGREVVMPADCVICVGVGDDTSAQTGERSSESNRMWDMCVGVGDDT